MAEPRKHARRGTRPPAPFPTAGAASAGVRTARRPGARKRAIRPEERIRRERLLPDDLGSRIEGDAGTARPIGPRFASNAKPSGLARRIPDGELADREAVERAIRNRRSARQRI